MLRRLHTRSPNVPRPARACIKPPTSRTFHSTNPNLLVAEIIEFSRSTFEWTHDATGFGWAGTLYLTGAVWGYCWPPTVLAHAWKTQQAKPQSHLEAAWDKYHKKAAATRFPDSFLDQAEWTAKQTKLVDSLTPTPSDSTSQSKVWPQRLLQATYLPIWLVNLDVVRCMTGAKTSILDILHLSNTLALIPPEPTLVAESSQHLGFASLVVYDFNELWPMVGIFAFLQTASLFSHKNWFAELKPDDRKRLSWFFPCFILPLALHVNPATMIFLVGSTSGSLMGSRLRERAGNTGHSLDNTTVRNARLKPEYQGTHQQLDEPSEPPTSTSSSQSGFSPGAGQIPTLRSADVISKHTPKKANVNKPSAFRRE